jgi:hypothetical protein
MRDLLLNLWLLFFLKSGDKGLILIRSECERDVRARVFFLEGIYSMYILLFLSSFKTLSNGMIAVKNGMSHAS